MKEAQFLEAHPSVTAIKDNINVSSGFNFVLLSQQNVKEALSSLDPKKEIGCDGITPDLLKMNADQLAPFLSSLYNSCIKKGKWPKSGKRVNGLQFTRKQIKMSMKIIGQ